MISIEQTLELALQYHQSGRLAEAEVLYRQILVEQSKHADALHLLGVVNYQLGRHDMAAELICQSIEIHPSNPGAHSNLGEIYRKIGRLKEAIVSFNRALQLKPDLPETYNNLGNALRDSGRLDEAIIAYHRSLQLEPRSPEVHNNLGFAFAGQRRLDEAIAAYRRALQFRLDYPEAHNNLGNALRDAGHLDEAMTAYWSALRLRPDYPEAHNNLGSALRDAGRLDEAITAYRCALRLRPDYPEAHNNLGSALRDAGHLDEAIAEYRRVLELQPDLAETHNNIGNTFRDRGQLDDAIAAYRRAIRFKPEETRFHSNLVYTLHFQTGEADRNIAEEQQCWNQQFISRHTNAPDPERRVRIGYVSPDFRDHVIGRNLLPLFKHHDRRRFEVACYCDVLRPDQLTQEFRQYADLWRSTAGQSDTALAEKLIDDGVDILMDLTQHMAGNRVPLFTRKSAPVQASFVGYPASTGVKAIEFRISDKWMEEGSTQNSDGMLVKTKDHEQVYLIDSFWCYDPCGMEEVSVNELPAESLGTITFGSLNNFCKVNDPLLKLWARVLKAVNDSRLIVLSHEGSHRQRTVQFLEAEGVESHRVEFAAPCPRKEYLELYHRLDIVLDTFPYNGHTTSLDALWMGVPVVSLCGERPVSRAGLSQLSNLGLPEPVAFTEDQYVEIAAKLAKDIPRLKELRATLRQRMEQSVLMDAPHFARQIEACYRSMWRQWCAAR